MTRAFFSLALLGGSLAGLAGCAGSTQDSTAKAEDKPLITYKGVETHMLQDDLVTFKLALSGGDQAALTAYADCAAAQYALVRGFGYARPVRELVARSGGTIRGNAAYLLSHTRPEGKKTIEAQPVVIDCRAQGIPTI